MSPFEKFFIGMTKTLQKKITIDDTALNYGSGKILDLFATPKLVALMVEASSQLMDVKLADGFVSVGNSLEVDHFKPTLIGSTVTIEVKVVGYENDKYLIEMVAFDEFGQIAEGKHSRSIVNYASLMQKARERECSSVEEN
jgi:predicted thioesterase